MLGAVLCPPAGVQCCTPPAIARQSVLVGAPIASQPDEHAGRKAAGDDERSDPLVARGPGARAPQQNQTGEPADTEEETAEQEQDDRGPFLGSATGRELVGMRRFGRDDRLGLAELVEHRECLRIRRTRVDRLGQVPLDIGEQFPPAPGRETTSGAAQALQILGSERMEGIGRHLSTPFPSRASTESRNRVHSITKPPSAAWPSGVRR